MDAHHTAKKKWCAADATPPTKQLVCQYMYFIHKKTKKKNKILEENTFFNEFVL